MRAINKITGSPIVGTLEHLAGTAEINDDSYKRDESGHLDFEYNGHTEIWWDEQRTIRRGGERVFVDENGDEVKESEIQLVDESEEE